MAEIERFWSGREVQVSFDPDGFLSDPHKESRWGFNPNPDAIPIDELRNARAVVMLGEVGTGKSTILQRAERLVPEGTEILAVNLSPFGSELRLRDDVLHHDAIERWKSGGGDLAVVWDGFDEAQERIPQLGQILANAIQHWPTERLWLRIASRTYQWSPLLQRTVEEAFLDTKVVRLLPLRRDDVRLIASELCADPDAFLHAVDRANASAFASRPQTLRMLITSFVSDGVLPTRAANLYDQGTRSLAEESNQGRLESQLRGPLSVDERIAIARRIAAGLTFGRAAAIWTGRESECPSGDLSVGTLAIGTEPTPAETVHLTVPIVTSVLATGLFTTTGLNRLGFAHASFGDFLAAAWVEENSLADDKVRALLMGPDGRVRPQLRAIASWLVGINPDRFAWLTVEDPEAALSQFEIPTAALRAVVIDGLFADPSRREWGWGDRLDGLKHPTIAEQIRPQLHGGTDEQQRLAVKLVRDCQIDELLPELIDIALDPVREPGSRTRAGYAAISVAPKGSVIDLASLALDENIRGDDPTDELLGLGLTASWPHAIDTAQVFSLLTAPKMDSLFGAYLRFIHEFSEGLQHEDVAAAITWLEAHLDAVESAAGFDDLADAVVDLIGRDEIVPPTAAALGRIAASRAQNYEGLSFTRHTTRRSDGQLTPESRRRLVNAVLDQTPDDDVILYLSDRSASGSGLVKPDDLEWVVAEAANATGPRLDALNELFGNVFVPDRRDHVELFLDFEDEHPFRRSRPDWVQVQLGSSTAERMKRAHDFSNRRKRDRTDNVVGAATELLDRIEGGDPRAFVDLGRLLSPAEHKVDLTATPGWNALSIVDKDRAVRAARTYLDTKSCDKEAWLDDTSLLHFAARAGYRALTLLNRTEPAALDQLSTNDWVEWAPIIATITCTVDGPHWEDKQALLRHADAHAHTVLVHSLTRYVAAAVSSGEGLFWANELEFLFDDVVEKFILETAEIAQDKVSIALIEVLNRKKPEIANPILRSAFTDLQPENRAKRMAAGTLLVDHDLAGSWLQLKSAFDDDRDLAVQVLGNAHEVRYEPSESFLPEDLIADIYLWLRSAFDPGEDPQPIGFGAYVVGEREMIGRWRDRLLIDLRDRGTEAAIAALTAIATVLPTVTSLLQIQTDAEANYAQKSWQGHEVRELVALATGELTALINTEADLLAVVSSAFGDIQRELTGSTPQSHLLWDTHSRRPKQEDEISDHLRNRLSDITSKNRLTVNREVQVRRSQPSGMPERADIQVDAATGGTGPYASLSLPVEVKGAWNDQLMTAMREQLAERYMADLHVSHGYYVVVWPDTDRWDSKDSRYRKVATRKRIEVIEELAEQARQLLTDGYTIEVLHLGIEYKRPDPSWREQVASVASRVLRPRRRP